MGLTAESPHLCRTSIGAGFTASRRPRRAWVLCLLVMPVLLVAASAGAASRESKERTARMACLSGDYAKGVAILSELFVDTKDANFIFNSGRCFEQSAKWPEAIIRFQEYLRVGKRLSADDKAAAEKHIADCQEQIARQGGQSGVAAAPAAAAHPPTGPQVPIMPAPVVAEVPGIVQPANPPAAAEPGSGLRTAGIITVDATGRVAQVRNSASMPWASISSLSGGAPEAASGA